MYHHANNLFFGLTKDGHVRIIQFRSTPAEWPKADDIYADVHFDVKISDGDWTSIVASINAIDGAKETKEVHYKS